MTNDLELADAIAWAERDAAIERLAEMSTGSTRLDWDVLENTSELAWGDN